MHYRRGEIRDASEMTTTCETPRMDGVTIHRTAHEMPDPAVATMTKNVLLNPAIETMTRNVLPNPAVATMTRNVLPNPAVATMTRNVLPNHDVGEIIPTPTMKSMTSMRHQRTGLRVRHEISRMVAKSVAAL